MSDAYFLNVPRIELSPGGGEKMLAKMTLPTGSYVILAKFNVALPFSGAKSGPIHREDEHGQHYIEDKSAQATISHFYLAYRGVTDASYCDLREDGELKTVVLTVAVGLTAEDIGLGRTRPSTVRLVCDSVGDKLEVAHICITAISADGVTDLSS